MNNFSGISLKVSPDLKRFIPGQINSKKASRRENQEKEEEESKFRSGSGSLNDKNSLNLNIRNVANVQANDSTLIAPPVNYHILNIKNMERELDRLMEKLLGNLRDRKQINSSACPNFASNLDNVFKSNTSQIVNVNALSIKNQEKKEKVSLEIPISEKNISKDNFKCKLLDWIIIILIFSCRQKEKSRQRSFERGYRF
jgi:hypothetical protein